MRVSKAQAAQNRQHILTAATRLFREQGIQATGVDAITHREGMRKIGNAVAALPTPCYCPSSRVRSALCVTAWQQRVKDRENTMAAYIDVEEAKKRTGLRLVVAPGIPGPWGEAIKGICYVKKIPFTLVRFDIGAENKALAEWSAQASVPVMIWNDEFPKSTWNQQLALAERLAPTPSLIPADIDERLLLFGYANELCGENGFGWHRRLMIVHQTLSTPGVPAENRAFAQYFGAKYSYSPEAGQAAAAQVVQILQSLGQRLESQKAKGSRYFLGQTLSALDIYWAAFATLIKPLPEEQCPMGPINRAMYTNTEASVQAAVHPLLMEHRDFIYQEHLELPIDL